MKDSPLVHLFMLPVYAIGAIAVFAGGATIYDAVVTSDRPWEVIGIGVLAVWLALIVLFALSRG